MACCEIRHAPSSQLESKILSQEFRRLMETFRRGSLVTSNGAGAFTAILRPSSLLSNLTAERRPARLRQGGFLFDYLVGAGEQCGRQFKVKQLRSLEVDY